MKPRKRNRINDEKKETQDDGNEEDEEEGDESDNSDYEGEEDEENPSDVENKERNTNRPTKYRKYKPTEIIGKNLNDKEIRKLVRSLRKFANPLERTEMILQDMGVANLDLSTLKEIIIKLLSLLKNQYETNMRSKDKKKKGIHKRNDINTEEKEQKTQEGDPNAKLKIGKDCEIHTNIAWTEIAGLDACHRFLFNKDGNIKPDSDLVDLPFKVMKMEADKGWESSDDIELLKTCYTYGANCWDSLFLKPILEKTLNENEQIDATKSANDQKLEIIDSSLEENNSTEPDDNCLPELFKKQANQKFYKKLKNMYKQNPKLIDNRQEYLCRALKKYYDNQSGESSSKKRVRSRKKVQASKEKDDDKKAKVAKLRAKENIKPSENDEEHIRNASPSRATLKRKENNSKESNINTGKKIKKEASTAESNQIVTDEMNSKRNSCNTGWTWVNVSSHIR